MILIAVFRGQSARRFILRRSRMKHAGAATIAIIVLFTVLTAGHAANYTYSRSIIPTHI